MKPSLPQYKRPVLVLGAGAQSARAEAQAMIERLKIPVALTWGAADIMPEGDLRVGTFGTHGTRAANFAVQNADFLLCIGTRLDTKATGTPAKHFARGARIEMVDIDKAEIAKMEKLGVTVNGYCIDAGAYMKMEHRKFACDEWRAQCFRWKNKYRPDVPPVIHALSNALGEDDLVVVDTGCTVAWWMQGWKPKRGQRCLHPWNNTPMGYALPGAIGAHYATGKSVTVLTGDGSVMMSIGEMATIAAQKLPIRIIILDNKGHAMCRQSQREWMGGTYPSTSIPGGLSFPDFKRVADAFGVVCEVVEVEPDRDVSPKVKAGEPNERMYPYLNDEEQRSNMHVEPISAS